jgi:hypothetical protein
MSAERVKDGPAYFATKPIAKVEVSQTELSAVLSELRAMRVEQEEGKLETANNFVAVFTKIDQVSTRVGDLEARPPPTNGSLRARVDTESQANLKQDAVIATLVTKVTSLETTQETQLDILKRLDAVAANPMVRKVAWAAAVAFLGWLGATGRLSR